MQTYGSYPGALALGWPRKAIVGASCGGRRSRLVYIAWMMDSGETGVGPWVLATDQSIACIGVI